MVRLGVGEADDFVLDRGAVADAGAHDGTAVEGGIFEVFADNLVSFGSGVGLIAGKLGERIIWSQRTQRRLRPIPIVVASCFAGDNR